MKKKYTLKVTLISVFMLFLSTNVLIAQPWQVTGTIQTENVNLNPNADFNINEPLPGITVRLFDGEVELDSDVTDVTGAYTLEHSVDDGELRIEASGSDAFQTRELAGIPAGEDHDEGPRSLFFVEGSVFYQGVSYRTVQIGDQIWMAENLRANSYRNGDLIPHVTSNSEWGDLDEGAWAIHTNFGDDPAGEDDPKNFNRGKLYNWFAVNDERGICPPGWGVPTDDDIKALEEELGMSPADLDELGGAWRGEDAGVSNALRSTGGGGDFFWRPDNAQEPVATNTSGFSMRGTSLRFPGGGFGQGDGDFSGLGEIAMIWSSTENPNNVNQAIRRIIRSNQAGIRRNTVAKTAGLAVRCVQVEEDETTSLEFDATDGAGWRMMSVPFFGKTVADLAAQNEVSGVTGANAFYGVDNLEEFSPNLNFFDPAQYDPTETESATGWVAPENFNTEFVPGQGFVWYFFDNDTSQSVPLNEFTLSLSGVAPSTDVEVPVEVGTWNLVGNPFPSNIAAASLSGAGLESAAALIWDSSVGTGTYVTVEFSGSNTISAWQGFFIHSDDGNTFTFPESATTDAPADFFSTSNDAKLAFTLTGLDSDSGVETVDKAISLILDDEVSTEWDKRDIRKLTPLSHQYATLSFVGMRGEEEVFKAQESQPFSFDESIELPMVLNVQGIDGSFTLEWDGLMEFNEDININLVDHVTGETINLRNTSSYTFESTADEAVNQHRFTLTLAYMTSSSEVNSDLPREFSLQQNYPNPFNPTTQITYDLPEQADVRLEVFNIQGQRVATLVNASKNAGTHSVIFDATHLASGVYLYRLQAGSTVLTRKMTLVK